MAGELIEVQQVSKQFGHHTVFEDITFTIAEGDIVALIGPNGSGKTTLAQIILGLDEPTSGEVFIDGMSPHAQKNFFGYVPQRFSFDRSLPITVEEFLSLVDCDNCQHDGSPSIDEALDMVGLGEHKSQLLGTLSGGQLQRSLIARALVHNRQVLILDEPAAGVDVSGESAIYDLLKKLSDTYRKTIIIISHEIDFVFKYAKQVLCINKQLLCKGVPKEALTADMLKELFGAHVHPYTHIHD